MTSAVEVHDGAFLNLIELKSNSNFCDKCIRVSKNVASHRRI